MAYAESGVDFVRQQSWERLVIFDQAVDSLEFKQLLANLDAAMQAGKSLKNDATTTLARISVSQHDWVIKRYNIKHWRHALSRAFRPSRAAISWCNAHRLQQHNIKTAKPVAMIENRWGLIRHKAYLICEYHQGVECASYFQQDEPNTEQRRVMQNIIDTLSALFKLNISHGDLKATNILIYNAAPVLIDLDGMRKHSLSFKFRRACRKDIKRFLKNWQQLPTLQNLFRQQLERWES